LPQIIDTYDIETPLYYLYINIIINVDIEGVEGYVNIISNYDVASVCCFNI